MRPYLVTELIFAGTRAGLGRRLPRSDQGMIIQRDSARIMYNTYYYL